jgi:hypothetical protein
MARGLLPGPAWGRRPRRPPQRARRGGPPPRARRTAGQRSWDGTGITRSRSLGFPACPRMPVESGPPTRSKSPRLVVPLFSRGCRSRATRQSAVFPELSHEKIEETWQRKAPSRARSAAESAAPKPTACSAALRARLGNVCRVRGSEGYDYVIRPVAAVSRFQAAGGGCVLCLARCPTSSPSRATAPGCTQTSAAPSLARITSRARPCSRRIPSVRPKSEDNGASRRTGSTRLTGR